MRHPVHGTPRRSLALIGLLAPALAPALAHAAGAPNGLTDITADQYHRLGHKGSGMTVGQLEIRNPDTGFGGQVRRDHDAFGNGLTRITNRDYFNGATGGIILDNVNNTGKHATNVAGVFVSNAGSNNGTGMLPQARLVNGQVKLIEGDVIRGVSDFTAYATSATHAALNLPIINISIYDGSGVDTRIATDGTSRTTRTLDWIVQDRNLCLVTIPGNAETSFDLRIPGDCYNSITVAAMKRRPNPKPQESSFNGWANFSRVGYTDDARSKPDIMAPGAQINMPGVTSNFAYSQEDGTSFAAPHVAGGIGLLMTWVDKTYPGMQQADIDKRNTLKHHLTIKSTLLSGANKPTGWSQDLSRGEPLDNQMGAGEMVLKATEVMLSHGQQDPGGVKNYGFDLGTTAAAAQSFDYALPGNLIKEKYRIVATLAWDRLLNHEVVGDGDRDLSNDTFTPQGVAPEGQPLFAPPRNLNLELFKNGAAGGDADRVKNSASPRDNVEHIYHTVDPGEKQFVLRVKVPTNAGGYSAAQKYAVSWRVATPLVAARGSADLATIDPGVLAFEETYAPDSITPYGSSPTAVAIASDLLNTGLAADPYIFTGDMVEQKLRVFNNNGSERSLPLADMLVGPRDLAFNSAGELFVASDSTSSSDSIVRVNPLTGQIITNVTSQLIDPHGLTLDANDHFWVAERTAGRVRQISPTGVFELVFNTPGGFEPIDLAWDSLGTLWVAANSTTAGVESVLLEYDAEGSLLFSQSIDDVFDIRSLAINPFDGNIFLSAPDRVVGYSVDGILRVDLSDPLYGIDDGGGLAFTLQQFAGAPLVVPEPAGICFAAALLALTRRRRRF